MKKSRIAQFKAGTAPLVVGIALIASPAFAQDTTAADTSSDDTGDIVVTGSLITNPNLEQATPVNVIGREQMELRQANVAEQLLRELPGVTPSIGSAVNNGNGGSSFVNLRNLGSNRNVVLLDGQRIVPAELNGRFDLNNVPLALIERVDVLTGGASTTYGADAVSGVVNFVTRHNFSGIEANLSQQLTEEGDGNTVRADVTIGANFDDGRGNAVFSIGYQQSDPVYQGDRPYGRYGLSSTTGGGGGSGTSIPSRFSLGTIGTRQVTDDGTAFKPTAAYQNFNFNPYNVYQTPFERFNMYGAANYQISDAIEVYTRGLFSKNTVETIIAPSGAFGIAVVLPLNNPYLTTALRNSFCAGNGISAADCLAAANPALRPGDAAYRQVTTALSRRAVEVGPRISNYTSTVFDYSVGAKGGITDTISWDIRGSYGESSQTQRIQGYTLNSRVRDSLLASDTTSCFAGTADGCVPVNWFGPQGNSSWTAAAIDFLSDESTVQTNVSLAQVHGVISGDFGVSSPFGSNPVSFAVGGEYRKYHASQQSDSLAAGGDLGGAGGAAPNINGGYDVYEAFGELIVPLIQDRPFFHDLTIEGGVRYSSYSVFATGASGYNTTTWKVAGSWAPVESFRIRGNYAHAVRAPNIAELFSPVTTALTNLTNDPCATLDDSGNPVPGRSAPTGELRAVCLAQGATTATINSIPQPTAGQANYTGGGNVNLGPEVGKTWTVGFVFEPTFLHNFSLTVDYYNIKVTGAVSSPTPGDAIAACFGTPTGNVYTPAAGASTTAACTQIRRNALTGSLSGDSADTPGLYLATSNLGTLWSSGVDVAMNYRHELSFADLSLAGQLSWTDKSRFQSSPTSDAVECVGYYSADCGQPIPEWTWSLRTTLSFKVVDVSLLWRHIAATDYQYGGLFEGTLPATAGPLAGKTVNFNHIPAYNYFDLTTRVNVNDNLTVTFVVQNLFDKAPPLVGGEAGSTSYDSGNTFPSTYDALGRRFVLSARLRF